MKYHDAECEWERLSNLRGTADQLAESGGWSTGLRVSVAAGDAAFYSPVSISLKQKQSHGT